LYSADAFSAVALPVTLVMVLSSVVVVWVVNPAISSSNGATGLPLVYDSQPGSSSQSSGALIGESLVNALVIVGVIVAATFVMVALYYFQFMRVLLCWLMGSTALLLAFSTGLVVQTAMAQLELPADLLTYSFVFYNFAIGGVVAVFYQRGIPLVVTQGYLMAISVTMAWVLISFLPSWTAWALLALLAVYDLCAVLTPCGPLKLLVGIMQERNAPLPGLLYEANVGGGGAAMAGVAVRPAVVAQTPSAANGGAGLDDEQPRRVNGAWGPDTRGASAAVATAASAASAAKPASTGAPKRVGPTGAPSHPAPRPATATAARASANGRARPTNMASAPPAAASRVRTGPISSRTNGRGEPACDAPRSPDQAIPSASAIDAPEPRVWPMAMARGVSPRTNAGTTALARLVALRRPEPIAT